MLYRTGLAIFSAIVYIVLAFTSFTFGQTVLPPFSGLVAYYPIDTGFTDVVGSRHMLISTGSVTVSTTGGAYTGSAGMVVPVLANIASSGSTFTGQFPYTVAFRFKGSDPGASHTRFSFGKMNYGASTSPALWFERTSSTALLTNHRSSTYVLRNHYGANGFFNDTWKHVVVVMSSTTSSTTYVNGSSYSSSTSSYVHNNYGYLGFVGGNSSTYYVDDIMVFSGAFTGGQVSTLYAWTHNSAPSCGSYATGWILGSDNFTGGTYCDEGTISGYDYDSSTFTHSWDCENAGQTVSCSAVGQEPTVCGASAMLTYVTGSTPSYLCSTGSATNFVFNTGVSRTWTCGIQSCTAYFYSPAVTPVCGSFHTSSFVSGTDLTASGSSYLCTTGTYYGYNYMTGGGWIWGCESGTGLYYMTTECYANESGGDLIDLLDQLLFTGNGGFGGLSDESLTGTAGLDAIKDSWWYKTSKLALDKATNGTRVGKILDWVSKYFMFALPEDGNWSSFTVYLPDLSANDLSAQAVEVDFSLLPSDYRVKCTDSTCGSLINGNFIHFENSDTRRFFSYFLPIGASLIYFASCCIFILFFVGVVFRVPFEFLLVVLAFMNLPDPRNSLDGGMLASAGKATYMAFVLAFSFGMLIYLDPYFFSFFDTFKLVVYQLFEVPLIMTGFYAVSIPYVVSFLQLVMLPAYAFFAGYVIVRLYGKLS